MAICPEENLPEGMIFKDQFVQTLYEKYFPLLAHIKKLMSARFRSYDRIKGMKKAWSGFLYNREVALAKHFKAALVREGLTTQAKEKDSTYYKNRTFNMMINNVAKGQYIRRALDKLKRDGLPELLVASYYTSTTRTVHSQINDATRSGEISGARCVA
jgi:hypothetical protein